MQLTNDQKARETMERPPYPEAKITAGGGIRISEANLKRLEYWSWERGQSKEEYLNEILDEYFTETRGVKGVREITEKMEEAEREDYEENELSIIRASLKKLGIELYYGQGINDNNTINCIATVKNWWRRSNGESNEGLFLAPFHIIKAGWPDEVRRFDHRIINEVSNFCYSFYDCQEYSPERLIKKLGEVPFDNFKEGILPNHNYGEITLSIYNKYLNMNERLQEEKLKKRVFTGRRSRA